MADEPDNQVEIPSLRKRRWIISANVLVQAVAALVLVGLINWLAARHYSRFDWTQTSYYALAEKTKQVLRALPAPVEVTVFIPETSEAEYIEKVLQDARNLLKDFQIYGRDKLRVEYVDPQRDLARAQTLVEKYKLESPDVVIFAFGDRTKYVRLDEMVELEQPAGFAAGGAPRVRAFKGEGEFLAAIQKITEEAPPLVYFLTGHGERDPEDFDPRKGYSSLANYIKRDNITVAKWNLLEKQALPTDAAALVIAGPRVPFNKTEVEVLRQYLRSQGRLLLLLDPKLDAGLKPLLEEWRVQVDDNLAVARGGKLLGTELMLVEALGTEYSDHPVVKKFTGINTIFPRARSIRRWEKPDAPYSPDDPRVTELVRTPAGFWGETNPGADTMEFNEGSDTRGPLPLAVAVESSKPQGVDLGIGATRLIVVGSASVVDNNTLPAAPGNLDFFMNSLNWLLHREQLVAIAPKLPQEFSLNMTTNQTRAVYALTIGGMPLAVAIFGLLVWVRRRK